MLRRRVTTAERLASELEVSPRTIYRDIRDLMGSGVPIEAEPGVGYMLRHYDLPPLMFTQNELEALVLGASIVESWADADLAKSAREALEKLEAAMPDGKHRLVQETPLFAPRDHFREEVRIDLAAIRGAIRDGRKLRLGYIDASGARTERIVRPLALAFYGPIWLLCAWCETRCDFRTFRPDRIESIEVNGDAFKPEPGKTLRDFLDRMSRDERAHV